MTKRIILASVTAAFLITWPSVSIGQSLPQIDERGFPTIAPLLDAVTPAVINISVVSEQSAELNPLLQDEFFRRFFDMAEDLPGQPRLRFAAAATNDRFCRCTAARPEGLGV